MTRFLIAIALALMSASTVACAASASDDTASICMPDLDDAALGQEAGPPAVDTARAADLSLPTSDAMASAGLGDDLVLDAISGATPLSVPIERATTALSMPAENHDDLPIPPRPRPYRKLALDERVSLKATAIEPGAARTPRRALE